MSLPEKGTRVRLVAMPDDPDPIPYGAEGTVIGGSEGFGPSSLFASGGQQVWVTWDSGRTLNLIPGIDRWEVIQ
jgi:hypothetical protein